MTSPATSRRVSNAETLRHEGRQLRMFPFGDREGLDIRNGNRTEGFSDPRMSTIRSDLNVLSRSLSTSNLLPPVAETFLTGHSDPMSETSLDRFKIDREKTPDVRLLAGLIAYVIGKEGRKELPAAFIERQLGKNPAIPLDDGYIEARLIQLSQEEPRNKEGVAFTQSDKAQVRAHAAPLTNAAVAAYIRQNELRDIDDKARNPHRLELDTFRRILINIKKMVDASIEDSLSK